MSLKETDLWQTEVLKRYYGGCGGNRSHLAKCLARALKQSNKAEGYRLSIQVYNRALAKSRYLVVLKFKLTRLLKKGKQQQ